MSPFLHIMVQRRIHLPLNIQIADANIIGGIAIRNIQRLTETVSSLRTQTGRAERTERNNRRPIRVSVCEISEGKAREGKNVCFHFNRCQ